MHGRIVVSILVLAPFLAATAEPRSLQEESGTAQQQAGATEEPQPIPEGEIRSRAALVAADLRRIEALLQRADNVPQIESTLTDRETALVALLGDLDQIDPGRISTRRLDDHRLPWLELRRVLDAGASVVQRRFAALQSERERLRDVRDQWEVTERDEIAAELAPELVRRIDDLLVRIVDVEARVRERRDAVGATVDRIAVDQEKATESLQRIDAMAAQLRARLFNRNAAPLWRAAGISEARPLIEDAAQVREYWVEGLLTYLRLHSRALAFLLAMFVVILLGAFGLRRQSRGWPAGDEATERASSVIGRPVSVALAFALALAVVVLPHLVGSAADVVFLLAAVPVLRLGSVVLASGAQRTLYGVALLTVLARISSLAPDGSLLRRLLLVLVTTLALAGVALLARRRRRWAVEQGGWYRAAVATGYAAALLLTTALGANIFGWLALSAMLADATVASVFGAVAWAAVLAATAALLPAILRGWLGTVLPSLRRHQATVCRITLIAATVVALTAWARGTLIRFQVYEPLRAFFAAAAGDSLSIGGLTVSIGGILAALLILIVTRLVARLVRFVLREEVVPRFRIPTGAGHSVITVANYTVYGVGIVLAASAAGLSGIQVTVVVGALSVGIGFGLQSIVNNFVSGLILMFERPIKVGDRVQTTDFLGTVTRIGIRAITIRRFDGAEVIVPNGDVIARDLVNWTRSDDLRRIDVHVGVAYGTDPESVLEILLRVAEQHPLVLTGHEPTAQMIRFGDSSLDFRLRCWTRLDNFVEVASDLHVAINKELGEAGITIPFPQHDLHVRSAVAAAEDSDRGSRIANPESS